MWIGTNGGGLNLFNEAENKFTHFTTEENSLIRLSGNSIYSICESKFPEDHNKTILWIGTNNGLNKIVIENSVDKFLGSATVKTFSTLNGLPDNSIKTIVERQ